MSLVVSLVLGTVLACVVSEAQAGEVIKIGGAGSAMRPMEILAEAFTKSHPGATITVVRGLGSRGSKRALLDGAIDIAISNAPMTAAEREQGLVAQEYARTPFVFATAAANGVSGLTSQQLVEIYSGKTVTWDDGGRLRLILRPLGDSDTAALLTVSPQMVDAVKAAHARPGMTIAQTDQDGADALENIPGALGTTTLTLIVAEQRRLKTLAIDGRAPTTDALAGGRYPYFKSYHLITRPNPSLLAQQFTAFIRSPQGRQILGRLGHWVP